MPQYSKYHSKKVKTAEGLVFDSKKEYRRYCELKMMEASGLISDLQRQVKFVLIPEQREPDTIGKRGGIHKGKLLERECSYMADFVYKLPTGETIVEDTKGMRLSDYKIKRKLMLYVKHIRIKEV